MLAQQLPVDEALRVADGWGGDAMVGYRKDGQQCVRAAFAGRTPADTSAIADGLQTWVAAQPAGSAAVEPGRRPGGALGVRRGRRRVPRRSTRPTRP